MWARKETKTKKGKVEQVKWWSKKVTECLKKKQKRRNVISQQGFGVEVNAGQKKVIQN